MKITDINGHERECVKIEIDKEFPGYVRVYFDNKVRQHHEWFSFEEFLEFNPGKEKLLKGKSDVPDEVTGVVTSSGKDFFRDSKAEWEKDEYKGMIAWISRGKGEGQQYKVVHNTKTAVYIKGKWKVKPNSSSQYVLASYVGDAKPQGNMLPQEDIKILEKRAAELDRKRRVVFVVDEDLEN